MISDQVLAALPAASEQFQQREPFRHVVIDGFLKPGIAAGLLAEFPAFNRDRAINENGEVGNKAVCERVQALGPNFSRLDALVQTRDFLGLVSRITSIPDLLYDPHYFGGGTHDNRNGQGLDAHVDFNRHPITHTHRRLNLIIYLNPDWQAAWGGVLELHSDPYSEHDRITRVVPLFNRAVIFETTEHSWHGFSPITLPASRLHEARRSKKKRSIPQAFATGLSCRLPVRWTQTMTHSRVALILGGSFSYHREMQLFEKIGYTPAQVLRLATLDMAKYLGQDQSLGSIEKGKLADFFLVAGDPTKDLRAIKAIRMVVKDGTVYFPSEIHPFFGIKPFATAPVVTLAVAKMP